MSKMHVSGPPVCSYLQSDAVKQSTSRPISIDSKSIPCENVDDACYAYGILFSQPDSSPDPVNYTIDNEHNPVFLAKGCWTGECSNSSCYARTSMDGKFFCCCRGFQCNDDVIFLEPMNESPVLVQEPQVAESNEIYYWVSLIITVFLIVGAVIIIAYRKYTKRKRKQLRCNFDPVSTSTICTTPCIDLGHGKYGVVYKGVINQEVVAVKTFSLNQKLTFLSEKYIYSLPLMEHSNLLSFLGGGECYDSDGNLCYGLVLSYCSMGNLRTFLEHNATDWPTFCHLCISFTRGLAHLHSEFKKNDLYKPSIAHRDFNTKNILLKPDLSCVVADLGFAVNTKGSKYYVNGEEKLAETSLMDVGTLRYMSPEVLEGAVNLRDCETALKEIDVYALGLVLWECAMRCSDLYQGLPMPLYKLPYQAEVGLNPTAEQMQILVVQNKARPLFPVVWKEIKPFIRLLKETIEDCWDQDAEARLSAACVEGRLSELLNLRDKYNKANNGFGGGCPQLSLPPNDLGYVKQKLDNENTPEWSISNSTEDNVVSYLGKNHFKEAYPIISPIQPHQGRNPCKERNTAKVEILEHNISENSFIDSNTSSLPSTITINLSGSSNSNGNAFYGMQRPFETLYLNDHLIPLLQGHSMNQSMQNDAAVTQRESRHYPSVIVPAIPYVQNEVKTLETIPKIQNENAAQKNTEKSSSNLVGTSWSRWPKNWEAKFRSLWNRKRTYKQDEEQQKILVSPSISSKSVIVTPLEDKPLNISSSVLNTQIVLCGSGLQTIVSDADNHLQRGVETEFNCSRQLDTCGVVKSFNFKQSGNISSVNEITENILVDNDSNVERARRPNKLIISHLKDFSQKKEVDGILSDVKVRKINELRSEVVLKKAKDHIKSPRHPVSPRLSLYDDRIMGAEHCLIVPVSVESKIVKSFSHSLPLDIDNLGDREPRTKVNHAKLMLETFSCDL